MINCCRLIRINLRVNNLMGTFLCEASLYPWVFLLWGPPYSHGDHSLDKGKQPFWKCSEHSSQQRATLQMKKLYQDSCNMRRGCLANSIQIPELSLLKRRKVVDRHIQRVKPKKKDLLKRLWETALIHNLSPWIHTLPPPY